MDYRGVLVLGDPGYYSRFGFRPAVNFAISFPFEAADKYCVVLELYPGALKAVSGRVRCPKAFLLSEVFD